MIPRIVLAYSLAFLLVVVMLANFGLNNVCADVVALWLFDEGSGDTAKDSSGNGHDGKIMSTPKWVDGMFGKALSFNGKDNYVDPGAFSIAYNNAYTQMLWVYPTMLQYGQTAGRGQSWDDQDGDIQLRIEDGEGHIKPHLWAGAWVVFQSAGVIKANEWSHLAVTFDGKSLLLYINGQLDATSGTAAAPALDKANDNPALIGAYLEQNGKAINSPYLGYIDEVCYIDETLESDTINEIITKGMKNYLAVQSLGKLSVTWGEIKKP